MDSGLRARPEHVCTHTLEVVSYGHRLRAKTFASMSEAQKRGRGDEHAMAATAEPYDQKRRKAIAIRARLANWRAQVSATLSSPAISGQVVVHDFVSKSEEEELLRHVNSNQWRDDLKRRVQHYGWVYDYKARSVNPENYLGPLPSWLTPLLQRMHSVGLVPPEVVFDQVIVNEYRPGQGISAHVDQPVLFGPYIVTVSLGSSAIMDFTRKDMSTQHLLLRRRSVARLGGEARYQWKHSIPARLSDSHPDLHGGRQARGTRISLTFRSMRTE